MSNGISISSGSSGYTSKKPIEPSGVNEKLELFNSELPENTNEKLDNKSQKSTIEQIKNTNDGISYGGNNIVVKDPSESQTKDKTIPNKVSFFGRLKNAISAVFKISLPAICATIAAATGAFVASLVTGASFTSVVTVAATTLFTLAAGTLGVVTGVGIIVVGVAILFGIGYAIYKYTKTPEEKIKELRNELVTKLYDESSNFILSDDSVENKICKKYYIEIIKNIQLKVKDILADFNNNNETLMKVLEFCNEQNQEHKSMLSMLEKINTGLLDGYQNAESLLLLLLGLKGSLLSCNSAVPDNNNYNVHLIYLNNVGIFLGTIAERIEIRKNDASNLLFANNDKTNLNVVKLEKNIDIAERIESRKNDAINNKEELLFTNDDINVVKTNLQKIIDINLNKLAMDYKDDKMSYVSCEERKSYVRYSIQP